VHKICKVLLKTLKYLVGPVICINQLLLFAFFLPEPNRKEVDREERVWLQKHVRDGNDPHGGHRCVCEGYNARIGVRHEMIDVKLLRTLHTLPWPPCGSLSSTSCFYTRTHYCHPTLISIGSGCFRAKPFPRRNTPTFSNLVILHPNLPIKMEQTECSKMSAHKIQTPGNYPEENIQHSVHGASLKSRNHILLKNIYIFSHTVPFTHINDPMLKSILYRIYYILYII
jgi:hypothetical protein